MGLFLPFFFLSKFLCLFTCLLFKLLAKNILQLPCASVTCIMKNFFAELGRFSRYDSSSDSLRGVR